MTDDEFWRTAITAAVAPPLWASIILGWQKWRRWRQRRKV
jgi:hypothetical protein